MAAAKDNAEELRQEYEWEPMSVSRVSEGQSDEGHNSFTMGTSDTGMYCARVGALAVSCRGGCRAISLCHQLAALSLTTHASDISRNLFLRPSPHRLSSA